MSRIRVSERGGSLLLVSLTAATLAVERPAHERTPEPLPPDSSLVPAYVLDARRAALLGRLEPGIAVLRSADQRGSHEYPQDSDFRQDNNFYYLTGLETPSSWLVVYKAEDGTSEVVLYLPEPDPQQEVWTGRRPGPGPETALRTGIADLRPATLFQTDLRRRLMDAELVARFPRLYLPAGARSAEVQALIEVAEAAGHRISDLARPLAALRMVKDSAELARLRRAVTITAEGQRTAMRSLRPGMHEYELEAIIEYVFRSRGAERVGFPSVVGSGPNSVILHHNQNRRRMEAGELVVVDVGAEFGYYTADITRTLPVAGKFSERQAAIYNLVLDTQQAVIDSIRPGRTVLDLERIARSYMRQRSGELCGGQSCSQYFLHGVSHWLGMDVHDVGSYSTPLAPGMVLTVEPGIYLAEEGLGVRIEDDVLVTADGREVLSLGAPRTVAEIESSMPAGGVSLPCVCR